MNNKNIGLLKCPNYWRRWLFQQSTHFSIKYLFFSRIPWLLPLCFLRAYEKLVLQQMSLAKP